MILLTEKHFYDAAQHLLKTGGKNGIVSGLFPIPMRQIERRAKRIHLIFTFPDGRIAMRDILKPFSVRTRIESVCIGIDADVIRLLGDYTAQNRLYRSVMRGIRNIIYHLHGRIT